MRRPVSVFKINLTNIPLDAEKKAEIITLRSNRFHLDKSNKDPSSEDWTLSEKDKTLMEWLFPIEPLPRNGNRIIHLLDALDLDEEVRLEASRVILW